MRGRLSIALVALAVLMGGSLFAFAAEEFRSPDGITTDTSSLRATRSIGTSSVIPAPAPTFGGIIATSVLRARAWWAPKIAPVATAPNILLILLDDVGYGAPSTYGGMIPMPYEDALAKTGLRYINFHTTAMCSPTRAALMTGRNQHTVGFGTIDEVSAGFPGYDAIVPPEAATVARVLQANGYATAWFGKDHNIPPAEETAAGPFDHWPVRQGFDYFYGFLGGETDQWAPMLYENTLPVFPYRGNPNYNLNVDLADKAVGWVNKISDLDPARPLFLYYAPGAAHAPHQPTKDWVNRLRGKFDYGWNAYRAFAFARQQQLGVVPKAARLSPWPSDLPQWSSLTPVQRKVYARQMEVYAAYLSETDYEVHRVIESFRATHRLDNTLIVYINGDNGASAEGTLNGTASEFQAYQGIDRTPEQLLPLLADWGGPSTFNHFAAPWAWAMDTPFKWTKQIASFFGGTTNGMTIVWPNHIADPGGVRMQFAHVTDIAPTLLDAAGIVAPTSVDGVAQIPLEGSSLLPTLRDGTVASAHREQYFELLGTFAMYRDGWIASSEPFRKPWQTGSAPPVFDPWAQATWHLYHVTPDADWTQIDDVAAANPDLLKSLQTRFEEVGTRDNVFPIKVNASVLDPRPSLTTGRTEFTYHPGIVEVFPYEAPPVLNRSYVITADVVTTRTSSGVIVAMGGRFGGYAMYVKDGRPTFTYNRLALNTDRWTSPDVLPPGRHQLAFAFTYDGGGLGKGGLGSLSVDGRPRVTHRIAATIPLAFPWTEGFSIGLDDATAVDERYAAQAPFAFDGTIDVVRVHLDPQRLTQADRMHVRRGLAEAAVAAQ
jgi:arylsulfatase A-like enzyme